LKPECGVKPMKLVRKMLAGDVNALSRLITMVEDELIDVAEVMQEIHSRLGHSYCIGITGPPGVGKSTLVEKLTSIIRAEGFNIGIILVDPTSPVSGGALLGDRIRLQSHYLDDEVFMRSMASRGKLGGLSKKVKSVAKIMDAFGKDFILLETVGTGQVETDIVSIADTNILVLMPHAGDIMQAMKAGIIELADVFVINKADLGKSGHLMADIESIVSDRKREDNWMPPVVETQAVNNIGIEAIFKEIERHRRFLKNENLLLQSRLGRATDEFRELVKDEMSTRITKLLHENEIFRKYLGKVETGELDPYSAFREILNLMPKF